MSRSHAALPLKKVVLITSGDLRQSANQVCWPAQEDLERRLTQAFRDEGVEVERAFPVDPAKGHGFISSQRMGMDIFAGIDPAASLVFATAAWQYTHHVLPGMRTPSRAHPHRRQLVWPVARARRPAQPQWLARQGRRAVSIPVESRISLTTTSALGCRNGLRTATVTHDLSHVRDLDLKALPASARSTGEELAAKLLKHKAILGVFDEGCMGMYNAIIDDELLNPLGVFKERLSQSALVARMQTIPRCRSESRAPMARRQRPALQHRQG